MSGVANTPKTGNECSEVKSSETINLMLEKEVEDMKTTKTSTTVHSTRVTIKLSITSLLVALIPKEYLTRMPIA
jgi:hypothetical protein